MANKTPLATWLYLNKQELNPQFTEFEWPKRILPEVFDFATSIEWKGVKSEGRGVDPSREIALEKSVAEAMERLVCHTFKHSSVGLAIAGAFDPTDNAKNESYERYFLNEQIDQNLSFSKIEHEDSLVSSFVFQNPKSKVEFFRFNTPSSYFGVICSITPSNTDKRALGFSFTNSLEKSIRKSFLEALPNYAWIAESKEVFNKIELPWHLEDTFLAKVEPLLTNTAKFQKKYLLPQLKELTIPIDEVSILKNSHIKIARFVVDAEGDVL